LPSRHGASPIDRSSTTPFDVSAAQLERSPGFDEHVTVAAFAGGAVAF
jgi:hypothetical protein